MMSSSSPAGEEVNLPPTVNKILLCFALHMESFLLYWEMNKNVKENLSCLVRNEM